MNATRALRIGAILLASSGLSACVAAIPLAASGVIAKTAADAPETAAEAEVPAPKVEGADIVVTGTVEDDNRTEDFVAMAMFALENADSGFSVVPDPAAKEDEAPVLSCTNQTPAILVDLDPGDAALRLGDGMTVPAAGLAPALAMARSKGVAVLWTSVLDESREDAVRGVLAGSGLDVMGRDPLLLTRDPAETKTERRRAALDEYCIKAIVGDRRGDFDALMDYLRDPLAPTPFDGLFGQGWFELPPPLDYAA